MLAQKRYIIGALCALMALESVLFVNAGLSRNRELIIGGADEPTHISINGNHEDRPGLGTNPEAVEPGGKSEDKRAEEARILARKAAEERGLLILVNKSHPIDSTYKPDDLQAIRYYAPDRSPEGRYLRKEAAEQFHSMVEAAEQSGFTLIMTTAYRSYGFQQILWENYVAEEGEEAAAKYSARPGHSEHQTGLAVDVTSPVADYELSQEFGASAEGLWLSENAYKFGFILRYPEGKEEITGYQYEPWHLRYVGKEVAQILYDEDLTLEEFLGG